MLIIVMLAVCIIVYFAFFAEKKSGFQDMLQEAISQNESSAIEDSVIGDSEVTASVKNKYITAGPKGSVISMAVFDCDDGAEREFALQKEIFDALYIDQRDTLVFSGAMFLGFGEYGGSEIDGDNVVAISHNDGFTDEDFDESIDIEQFPESGQYDTDVLSIEDKQALECFRNHEKLPKKLEQITDDPDTLSMYKTAHLLKKMTVYPFLAQEEKVVRMFERVFSDAMDDMRGYDGDSRRGMAADDIVLNGSNVRLVITVQEVPKPLRCLVRAELGVND